MVECATCVHAQPWLGTLECDHVMAEYKVADGPMQRHTCAHMRSANQPCGPGGVYHVRKIAGPTRSG